MLCCYIYEWFPKTGYFRSMNKNSSTWPVMTLQTEHVEIRLIASRVPDKGTIWVGVWSELLWARCGSVKLKQQSVSVDLSHMGLSFNMQSSFPRISNGGFNVNAILSALSRAHPGVKQNAAGIRYLRLVFLHLVSRQAPFSINHPSHSQTISALCGCQACN